MALVFPASGLLSALSPVLAKVDPTSVTLASIGSEYGESARLLPLLSASIPRSARKSPCTASQNWPLPFQPYVQSNESSCAPYTTAYFTFTVPPKNSMPSSPPSYTAICSTVVPAPTPSKVIPLCSFSELDTFPVYSTRTYFSVPELWFALLPP